MNPPSTQTLVIDLHNRSIPNLVQKIIQELSTPSKPAIDTDTRGQHFHAIRLLLKYLVGTDIEFHLDEVSSPEARMEQPLLRLYTSQKTRELLARLLGGDPASMTPELIHHFFARMAWLNEPALNNDRARKQLNNYLFGEPSFSDPDIELGDGDYSQLGELLTPVPVDLRLWMLQFKRGERYAPIAEWLELSTPAALFQGLINEENPTTDQDHSSVFQTAVSRLLASHGDDRDDALEESLVTQLDSLGSWVNIELYLEAIPADLAEVGGLRADWLLPMSFDTRRAFFQKITCHALNPDSDAWLPLAIKHARYASGYHALSLAIELHEHQPTLGDELAFRLASLLLSPLDINSEKAPLPNSRTLPDVQPTLSKSQLAAGAESLFQALGIDLLCRSHDNQRVLRHPAAETWRALMQTSNFGDVFQPMLADLQWYGGNNGEQASARITQALASQAITATFLQQVKAEELIYSTEASTYSHQALREELRRRTFQANPSVSPGTLSLLEYLLLREIAPELLIEGVPDHLHYGRSLQSVMFIHGVALLEASKPGVTLEAGYDEWVGSSLALAESTDLQVKDLWAKTQTLPALRYAVAHGVVTAISDLRKATGAQIATALRHLQSQQNAHAQALHALLSPKAPDRRALAEQQLTTAGVAEEHWNIPPFGPALYAYLSALGIVVSGSYAWDSTLATPGILDDIGSPTQPTYRPTLVELVMMGEFYVNGVTPVPQTYEQAFSAYQNALSTAQAAIIKRLLKEMPLTQQSLLRDATCEISRLTFDSTEGEYGIFLRCQPGDRRDDFHDHNAAQEYFFEVIPAAGVARQIEQDFRYVAVDHGLSGNIVETVERRESNAQAIAAGRITPIQKFDSDAYQSGTVSRSSRALNHPLAARLVPSPDLLFISASESEQGLTALAQATAEYLFAHPLEKLKEQNRHETEWEKTWAFERTLADTAARLIIPFYGCARDLSQGDRSLGTIAGCTLDVVFALIPLAQFARSTARLIFNGAEMGAKSVASLVAQSVGELASGLAQQSGIFFIRELPKLLLGLTRFSWATLAEQLPALRKLFAEDANLTHMAIMNDGRYQWLPDTVHGSLGVERSATVDGLPDVAVHPSGQTDTAQFKLLDPYNGKPYGPTLNAIGYNPLELSSASMQNGISPGVYPNVLPMAANAEDALEFTFSEACDTLLIERNDGVIDVVVDHHVYRLNTESSHPALRALCVEALASETQSLEELEALCRPVRDLIPKAICADFIKIGTRPAVPDDPAEPVHVGRYASVAFHGREYQLARCTARAAMSAGRQAERFELLVHEGKFCKWADAGNPTGKKTLIKLTQQERSQLLLPDEVRYLPAISGRPRPDYRLGFMPGLTPEQKTIINLELPVIELDQISSSLADHRSLRGIRLELNSQPFVMVEADPGIFYKAREGAGELAFTRVTTGSEIRNYLDISEQYRFMAGRTTGMQDRENIARLLFDWAHNSDEFTWRADPLSPPKTYEEYVLWCSTHNIPNDLQRFAQNILSGETQQKNFVDLARSTLPDFKNMNALEIGEQQPIIDVLNNLLPVQDSTEAWTPLDLKTSSLEQIGDQVAKAIKRTNIAYMAVETQEGAKAVYYSLSGGRKARGMKLLPFLPDATEHVLDGITYIDAGTRMRGQAPDPSFTSLPVLRREDRLVITTHDRYLDSERLIASVIKQDLLNFPLRKIEVFTLMDTCRSCGGVVLPELKRLFPDVDFSVRYIKSYTKG